MKLWNIPGKCTNIYSKHVTIYILINFSYVKWREREREREIGGGRERDTHRQADRDLYLFNFRSIVIWYNFLSLANEDLEKFHMQMQRTYYSSMIRPNMHMYLSVSLAIVQV